MVEDDVMKTINLASFLESGGSSCDVRCSELLASS